MKAAKLKTLKIDVQDIPMLFLVLFKSMFCFSAAWFAALPWRRYPGLQLL